MAGEHDDAISRLGEPDDTGRGYSLLVTWDIFMSLPVVYGEGDKALGRFLAQLLTSVGDPSICAWTGRSGSFNSCLPADIAVFNQSPTTHIPRTLERADMVEIIASLRSNSASIMRFLTDFMSFLYRRS